MCNGTHLQMERFPPTAGLEPGTTRSVGQHLKYGLLQATQKMATTKCPDDFTVVRKGFSLGVNIHRTSFPGAVIGSDHELIMMTF